MKWTDEEKTMLFSDMTNSEIARLTGRTYISVRKMRQYYTQHTVEKKKWKPLRTEREAQGVAHVVQTAERIGAKLLDVR